MQPRLYCIQTYYDHWAQHSGYHRYLDHLQDIFDVKLIRVRCGQAPPIVRPLMRWLKRNFHRRWYSPWATDRDILQELKTAGIAASLIGQGREVIIHFLDGEHGYNLTPFLLGPLARHPRLRVFASYHQPPAILQPLLRPDSLAFLHQIILVGPSQISAFPETTRSKLQVLLHGIDTDFYRPPASRSAPESAPSTLRTITVGHWLRDYDTLERIVAVAGNDIRFLIVGAGEHTKRLQRHNNTEVYTDISDEELLRLYQSADIGLMPLSDSTANNGVLEMLACGLPILVTDVGSVSTYVREGEAVLLPRNDPELFLKQLNRIRLDSKLQKRLALRARRRAEDLAWPKIAAQFLEIYQRELKRTYH